MNIQIRNEMPQDYRLVEELTREAFRGSLNHPTCDGEHLVVRKLRNSPSFVPELDIVAEVDGKIMGYIIYSLAKVVKADHQEIQVLSFGSLSVHPSYQRMGIGSVLMRHSIAVASQLVYDVDLKEVAEFEKGFPYKEPAFFIPIDIHANKLPLQVMLAFKKHEIHFISQL